MSLLCCISRVFLFTSGSLSSIESWQVCYQSLLNAASNTLLIMHSSQKDCFLWSVSLQSTQRPTREAYYIIRQWWDNAAAHVLNIAIGTQSPKTLYGYVMVVISLPEYSVVWSHTIYEIDFLQLLFLIKFIISSKNEISSFWYNLLSLRIYWLAILSKLFCFLCSFVFCPWSSLIHSVLSVWVSHYRWESWKVKLLNEGRIHISITIVAFCQ